MSSLICSCGKEKISTQKKICEECRIENKRERNKISARKHRIKYGSKVKRGIYCSGCKGVKENQSRGYCLACDRDRYKNKSKPDCATCGKIKENPRDAYCKECKRIKARIKSIEEGRRPENPKGMGRKIFCSNCGREKGNEYLNESYCGTCKIFRKKLNRPFRSEEQIFKENVRRLTWFKISEGILIKKPCEICGEIKVDAHHDDYYKPLDVRWLCKKHHREHHLNEQNKD